MYSFCEKKDSFGECGFSGVNVCTDSYISDLVNGIFHRMGTFLFFLN
jgi:hypothetical protein